MAVRTLVSALAGLLVLLLARGAWADVEVTMEDKVEVFMGSSTQITCMFTSADGLGGLLIRWFYVTKSRDRQKIYEKSPTTDVYDRGTQFTGRIAVNITFSGTSGEAVMTVSDVQLQDEREFICLVKSLTDGVGEGRTMLKVFKTPQNPTFEAVPNGVFVSDSDPSKIGTCEVKDGYPEPQVTWYKNLHPLRDGHDGVSVIPRVTVDKELFSVTSELHMVVKKEDKDALFYCEVMYETPGGTMMQETKPTKITVYYPSTSVRVWVESPKGLIKEGDSLEVLCQGDGHDPSEAVTVTHDMVSVDSNTLVVNNVTRLNSGVYECISLNTNTFEEIKGNTTVFVNYLDPAVVEAKAATVVQGEKLEVTCNALSSLQTLATWFKDGKKISEGHKLMLTVMNFDEAGTYVCVVTVPEIDDMQTSGEVEVHVLGPPQILTAPNTELSEYFESTVDLNCDVRGFPQSIGWHTPEGKVLKPNYPAETEDGVRSVLTLKVTSDITAVCNISNEYGSSAITYNIKAIKAVSEIPPKKIHKESNNVTIAVIIIFLLLLAILGSVLYFLYKKGRICGRSGKQDLTKDKSSKDNIVVEMKSDNTEEAILLGVNGEKLSPSEQ